MSIATAVGKKYGEGRVGLVSGLPTVFRSKRPSTSPRCSALVSKMKPPPASPTIGATYPSSGKPDVGKSDVR